MSAEKQLARFIARYAPAVAAVAKAALAKMRRRLPGAIALMYDNYNALVIAFGPTERVSDVVFSIELYPRWVTLFFKDGATLADPQKLLKGSGKAFRHIVLDGAATLDRPAVRDLMDQAQRAASKAIDPAGAPAGAPRLVIKAVSAKQRPRRPSAIPAKKTWCR
jgi:hypothetical protein